jgi:hypothetical protein
MVMITIHSWILDTSLHRKAPYFRYLSPNHLRLTSEKGALGKWHAVAQLTVPREGFGLTVTSSGDTYFLHAFGGTNHLGAILGTYEYLKISVTGDDQTFGSWTLGSGFSLSTARTDINAVTMTNDNLNTIPTGHQWIFIGAGLSSAGLTDVIEAVKVDFSTGNVALSPEGVDASKNAAGYCFFRANNFLYYYAYDNTVTTGLSRAVQPAQSPAEGGSCNNNCFPAVQTFNTDVSALSHPRR